MTLIDFVFSKLRTLKTLLDKCRKCSVSEDTPTSNIEEMPKHCLNLQHSSLSGSVIAAKSIETEKVSPIGMQNLGTAC